MSKELIPSIKFHSSGDSTVGLYLDTDDYTEAMANEEEVDTASIRNYVLALCAIEVLQNNMEEFKAKVDSVTESTKSLMQFFIENLDAEEPEDVTIH